VLLDLRGSRKPGKDLLMFSKEAIHIENLSKCYQIYDKPSLRLRQMLMRGRKQYYREFWALRDVSFSIKKGETVGIIGRNGSGKSTLLQLICGTLAPTSGTINTKGRVAALLELGSGFNPEFSGRENVYMNASILGLGHDEIDAKFNSIAEFADIGEFINQPVKTYSSGMMVRLSFAVAVAVEPEILIIDEALAVGDELFQRKCYAKIEAIKSQGATVLIVSHSGSSIVQLCDRAILLDGGEMLTSGEPKQIYGMYQQLLYALDDKRANVRSKIKSLGQEEPIKVNEGNGNLSGDRIGPYDPENSDEFFDPYLVPTSRLEYDSKGARIRDAKILTLDGKCVNHLVCGRRYIYQYHVDFEKDIEAVRFGMLIKTKSGIELGGTVSSSLLKGNKLNIKAGTTYLAEFDFRCLLTSGTYFLNSGVLGEISGVSEYLHRILDVAMFKVQEEKNSLTTAIVDFECKFKAVAV